MVPTPGGAAIVDRIANDRIRMLVVDVYGVSAMIVNRVTAMISTEVAVVSIAIATIKVVVAVISVVTVEIAMVTVKVAAVAAVI